MHIKDSVHNSQMLNDEYNGLMYKENELFRDVAYHSIQHLCIRNQLLDIPNITIKWHKLNKSNINWLVSRQFNKTANFIIINSTHDNTVDLGTEKDEEK